MSFRIQSAHVLSEEEKRLFIILTQPNFLKNSTILYKTLGRNALIVSRGKIFPCWKIIFVGEKGNEKIVHSTPENFYKLVQENIPKFHEVRPNSLKNLVKLIARREHDIRKISRISRTFFLFLLFLFYMVYISWLLMLWLFQHHLD